ncbi:SurA N-terminal domain-containing protein [bacterium]|nr:SurA N-terminal domain-containing protein [bacterium]
MFESFRKNQKFVLAILAIAAMIAFILGGFLNGIGRSGEDPVVATVYGEPVRLSTVRLYSQQRQQVNEFLRRAALYSKSTAPPQGFPIDKDNVIAGIALSKKADRMGITVNDEEVMNWLNQITEQKLTGDDFEGILRGRINPLKKTASNKDDSFAMSDVILFSTLRRELAVERLLRISMPPQSTDFEEPADVWERESPRYTEMGIEFVEVPVKKYIDEAAAPNEQQLKETYNKYATVVADTKNGTPGFLQPRRIDVQYLAAKVDDFAKDVKVTDEEIAAYYEKNKEEFTEIPKPTLDTTIPAPPTPPTDAPAAPAGDKPAETPAPAGDKPAENPTPEKPAESPKPETPAEPKPETPSEPPKPTEPAPEKPPEPPKTETPGETKPAEPPKPETPPQVRSKLSIGKLAAALALSYQEAAQPPKEPAPAAEPAKESAPAAEAPKEGAPAAESPKETAPAAEPAKEPATAPAVPTGPIIEQQSPLAPANPASGEPALPIPPDSDITIAPPAEPSKALPPPRVKPLEEVKEEIRQILQRQKGRELAKASLQKTLDSVMTPYFNDSYLIAKSDFEASHRKDGKVDLSGFTAPNPPDLAKVAAENHYELKTTGLLSLEQLDLLGGLATATRVDKAAGTGTPESFRNLVFNNQIGSDLYFPRIVFDSETNTFYAYWKIADLPPTPKPFDEVKDEVVKLWRLDSARPKAKEQAEAILKKAKETQDNLQAGIPEGSDFKLQTTETFPRVRLIPSGVNPGIEEPLPVKIANIPSAGERFLDEVFKLKKGEMAVVPGEKDEDYFVVKATTRNEPDFSKFAKQYQQDTMQRSQIVNLLQMNPQLAGFLAQRPDAMGLAIRQLQTTRNIVLQQILDEAHINPPLFQPNPAEMIEEETGDGG